MLVKRKRRKGPGQEGLITASPFLMPSLIGLLVFSLLPLLISAFISLTDWNGLDQLTAPGFFQEHFIGLDNYKAILSSPEFWGVLWNTFRYIIMYIPLMLVASLGVAYLLSRQRPGVTAFRIIYYIPVLTSWVAASMIWKSMLSPEYGAVNNILAVFGIQGPGWLLDEAWAMPAIVLVSVWKDMGFFGLILLSGMVGINKSYYYVVSILIAVVAMIPFLWMISTSLKSRGALMSIPIEWIPAEPSLDAYGEVFSRFPFLKTIGNSLFISVSYTVITLISASMAAFAFAKIRFRCANLLLKLYLATMMIPTQVTMIPLFVIMNRLGLIDSYASVILPSIFRPFAVFMLVQQMRTVPVDYLDAARVDGANIFQVYSRVALPLCAPTLATLAVTTFMESWNDYLWPLLMLTDRAKMTLPIALSTLNGQYNTEYNVLMAGSLISMIPIIIIYLFAQKHFKNGLMAGGIKG